MNSHTGGIILFILFNCLPNLCAAAAYGDNCTDTSECTGGNHLECDADKKCSCSTGYIANGTVCNADLGTDCSNGASCHDENAECGGAQTLCSCKNTHYDDNGDIDGGTCQLKKILDEECPDPNTAINTCSTVNSDCLSDDSSSTNHKCKCVSPYMEQTATCVVTWSDWSNWGNCNVTCGSGTRTRTGTCPVADKCIGDATQTESCTSGVCPVAVDGGVSEWSAWSSCTVSCAGGSQTRSRTCTNPEPQNGGKQCTDNLSETQACNSGACPEVEFGQTCTINGDKCKGTFTDCIGGTCKCISEYFRNGNACEAKIELGSTGCSTTVSDSCKSPHATCQSNGGSCTCNGGYYDDNGSQGGGTCRQKIELGSNGCSTTVTDSCKSPNAECQSNRYCTCNNGYYDDNGSWAVGGTCRQKIELGSSGCSTDVTNSCKSPDATCQTHGGSCTCNSGYYDDNGSGAGGTCTRKTELGSTGCSTTVTDSCMSLYATCQTHGGYCTCNSGYYDNNGGQPRGTCTKKIELGSYGCSTTLSDSCKSPDATCLSNRYCSCNNGYYDDNGSGAGGTCTRRKDLGVQCSNIPNECADANAACLDNKCTCGSKHYDNNGFDAGGSCESVSDIKVTSIAFQSVTTSGFTVSWTPPSGKASHINKYEVEWSLKISDNSLTGGNSVVPVGTTSFDISTGVTAGKTYEVKVKSINTNTRKDHYRTTFLTSEQTLSTFLSFGGLHERQEKFEYIPLKMHVEYDFNCHLFNNKGIELHEKF